MTTAIALGRAKGELSFALALGNPVNGGQRVEPFLRARADRPLNSGDSEMKWLVRLSLLGILAVLMNATAPAVAKDKSIVVASTTSTQDSGLYGYLRFS